MTSQQVSAKKGKSVAENLIILVMIGLFMATFIYYFFKQEQHLSQTGFDAVANTFSARLNGIHAQWFMDNQPNWVIIKENTVINGESKNTSIEVNAKGWVDVSTVDMVGNRNNCQIIWQQVLGIPMFYIKQPISAVMVIVNTRNNEKKSHVCRYGLPSGEYFDYQPSNGKVSKVQVHQ
ncbi:MAG: competence protein ComGC [Colwellia sp.]|jgi:competence protein ComGC